MTRPSTLLRWANAVTGSFPGRLEPNSGKKDVGFDDGEAPPAGHHNWLFGVAGDWITYLDEQAARAVFADVANTFTAAPQSVDTNDNETALLTTTKRPEDAPGGGSGAIYKLVLAFPLASDDGGHSMLRFYTGRARRSDSFVIPYLVISYNALWSTNTADWRADHSSGTPASALLFYTDRVEYREQPIPAPASWTTWPDNGGIAAGGNLIAGGDFTYKTPKTRTKVFPISLGANAGQVLFANGDIGTDTTPSSVPFPFVFPDGALINNIEVAHYDATAGRSHFVVMQHVVNWVTPGVSTMVQVGPNITAAAGTGNKKTVIPFTNYAFDPTTEYQLWWLPGSNTDYLQGIRGVGWTDAGPTNG